MLRSFKATPELVALDNSISVQDQNIQRPGTAIFGTSESPEIMMEVFSVRHRGSSQLRQRSHLLIPSLNTVYSGLESMRFFGVKILDILSNEIKSEAVVRRFSVKKLA